MDLLAKGIKMLCKMSLFLVVSLTYAVFYSRDALTNRLQSRINELEMEIQQLRIEVSIKINNRLAMKFQI